LTFDPPSQHDRSKDNDLAPARQAFGPKDSFSAAGELLIFGFSGCGGKVLHGLANQIGTVSQRKLPE